MVVIDGVGQSSCNWLWRLFQSLHLYLNTTFFQKKLIEIPCSNGKKFKFVSVNVLLDPSFFSKLRRGRTLLKRLKYIKVKLKDGLSSKIDLYFYYFEINIFPVCYWGLFILFESPFITSLLLPLLTMKVFLSSIIYFFSSDWFYFQWYLCSNSLGTVIGIIFLRISWDRNIIPGELAGHLFIPFSTVLSFFYIFYMELRNVKTMYIGY